MSVLCCAVDQNIVHRYHIVCSTLCCFCVQSCIRRAAQRRKAEAVTRNLFRVRSVFSRPIRPFPSFPLPSLPLPQNGSENPAKRFWGRGTLWHVPSTLHTSNSFAENRPQTHFCCIHGPGNVSDGCKCRTISVKRNLTRSLALAKRPCDCCVGQFWPKYNGKRIFYTEPYRSIFNHWRSRPPKLSNSMK